MVDSGGLVQRIVVELISFVQSLVVSHLPNADKDHEATKKAIVEVLRFTKNFLMVLDDKKSAAYKIAIVAEFLDLVDEEIKTGLVTGFENLSRDIYRMEQYIVTISADPVKQEILLAQVTAGVNHFIDPNSLHPPTVIFWLKQNCDMETLKKMQALMLFVNKQDHAKILQHDTILLQDKKMQFLLQCLGAV